MELKSQTLANTPAELPIRGRRAAFAPGHPHMFKSRTRLFTGLTRGLTPNALVYGDHNTAVFLRNLGVNHQESSDHAIDMAHSGEHANRGPELQAVCHSRIQLSGSLEDHVLTFAGMLDIRFISFHLSRFTSLCAGPYR